MKIFVKVVLATQKYLIALPRPRYIVQPLA
jgi:hypothetical protein